VTIPRIIHTFWDTSSVHSPPTPEDLVKLGWANRALLRDSDYAFNHHTTPDLSDDAMRLIRDTSPAVRAKDLPRHISNCARLSLLRECGGIYVDMDVEMVGAAGVLSFLDSLPSYAISLAAAAQNSGRDRGWENWFIAASDPNSSIVSDVFFTALEGEIRYRASVAIQEEARYDAPRISGIDAVQAIARTRQGIVNRIPLATIDSVLRHEFRTSHPQPKETST